MAASATSTLSRLSRVTIGCVTRSRLAPCRIARRLNTIIRRRGRTRAVEGVEWFDDLDADELAG